MAIKRINLPFDIGDFVWCIHNNRPKKLQIVKIEISISLEDDGNVDMLTGYSLAEGVTLFAFSDGSDIFKTKEDLAKFLLD